MPVGLKNEAINFKLNLGGEKNVFHGKKAVPTKRAEGELLDDDFFCPSCKSFVNFEDQARGEKICEHCGTVIRERNVALSGPGFFVNEAVKKNLNYEPMTSSNRIIIVVRKSDSPEARRRANCNNRMPWPEKKVQIMRAEIMKLKTFIPITETIESITMKEIQKVFKNESIQGRNFVAMGTALLYYACIQCDSSVGFDDIVQYSSEDRKSIRKAISILNKTLNYKFSPKAKYGNDFSRANNILSLPQYVCTNAIHIFTSIKDKERIIGDPRGLVGASIYYCCKNDDSVDKKTQREVASSLGITEITIRKRMKDVTNFIERNGHPVWLKKF